MWGHPLRADRRNRGREPDPDRDPNEEAEMFPTVQLELIRVVQAERLAEAGRATVAEAAPVTPAHIRTFGPRASRRTAEGEGARIITLPRQRQGNMIDITDRALLEA